MEGDVRIVQITIRDRQLRKLTAINNEIPEMLSFQNDTFHLYRENSTSTFDFTIPKWYNGKLHDDVRLINDDVYISFIDDDRHYYFYVHTLVQDDFNFILTCNDANLEYTMEQANPFVNSESHNIEWYLKSMDLLELANVHIGLNEISDITRTLSFDNQETKLERLSSLISQFGGEFDLVAEVDKNGKYSGTRLDIYHEADDTHHGVGKVRGDVTLTYGKDVKGVQVTSDKDGFFNAGIFTGADGLNITDLDKSEKDADGNEEYYTRSGSPMIYAPKSRDKYPSSFLGSDKWTRRDFSTDYKDKNELYAYALRTIKQCSMPQKTYLVSAQSDMLSNVKKLSKGDTVYIYDKNFEGGLLIKARVSEVIKSFTNPMNDTYVFSNYVLINREVSATLQARIDEILASKIPYRIVMVTSNGTSFKNGTGQSIVSPKLFKGDTEITDATYRFNFNNNTVAGLNYTVNASAVNDTSVLKIDAYVGNDVVASDELTFINVNDGLNGSKGADGNGIASSVVAYQAGASATVAPTGTWSSSLVSVPAGQFLWTRTIFTYTDTTTKTIYNVSRQGIQGPAGADGKTPYWHTAYANSADGKTGFSITDSVGKQFIGQYTDYVQADSTDPTKYKWVNMVGAVKVGGSNILLNSRFENTSTDPYSFTVGGVTYNTKPDYWALYNSGIPNATTSYHAYVDKSMSVTNVIAFNESDGSRNWKAINQTVSSRVPNTSKDFMISLDMYATGAGTKAYGGFYYVSKSTGAFNFHAGQFNIVPSAIGKWVRESAKVPFNPDDCDFTKEIRFYIYGYGFTTNSILYIDKVMLENSTVASVHSDAPEELQAKIDSKADQALTQAQMLALEERSALARDNAIAEAMKNTISEVEAKWQTWYNLNTADEKQKVANDIASLLDRVAKFEQNLGEASAKFSFINNETLIGEEGVAIGDKEGKAKLFLSNDSISFVTNGVAQMTLTGDTLTIKNGLFTERIQIGNYVEEVYDRNPLYNVIRPIKYS